MRVLWGAHEFTQAMNWGVSVAGNNLLLAMFEEYKKIKRIKNIIKEAYSDRWVI